MPRFLVVGGGAIGGLVGGLLSLGSDQNKVVMLARGPHLEATRARGGMHIRLNTLLPEGDKRRREVFCNRVVAVGSLKEAAKHGPFDVVFLTVKAHQLRDVALEWTADLSTPATSFVTMQNGLPWWFFLVAEEKGRFSQRRIRCLDPDGILERTFPVNQVLGSVALPAAFVEKPGVINHENNLGILLGRGNGAEALARALVAAGFEAPVKDIRQELWIKLLGSAFFNPASTLTGATLAELTTEGEDLCLASMDEVRAVANAVGHSIPVANEKRLAGARRIGDHKTSMLQDVESGKTQVELDALVTSVCEVAQWAGVSTPILSLVRRLVQVKLHVAAARASQSAVAARL